MDNQIEESIFDEYGYRFNVAIVIVDEQGQVFWGKRRGQNSWQFPQGGMNAGESADQAMLRELYEETGLTEDAVEVLGSTNGWLKYRLPIRYRRRRRSGMVQCIGQRQKWYLLRLRSGNDAIDLKAGGVTPEFDDWRWIDYWSPMQRVVNFKRSVYQQALKELAALLPELPSSDRTESSSSAEGLTVARTVPCKAPSFAKKVRHQDINNN